VTAVDINLPAAIMPIFGEEPCKWNCYRGQGPNLLSYLTQNTNAFWYF